MNDASFLQHQLLLKAEHRPFDLDVYYEQIRGYTPQSHILSVSPELAQSIVSFYQARFNHKEGVFDVAIDGSRLRKFEVQLDRVISDKFGCGTSVFVRMTNRSPKDGNPRCGFQNLREVYEYELAKLGCDDANAKMVAASAAQMSALKCRTGTEILNLLLSSERVFVDLLLALGCHESEDDEWQTCIILRKFDDNIRGDQEWRCFVHEKKLVAISQYNHYCVFPSLQEIDRRKLVDDLLAFWKEIRGCIVDASSYVMDAAFIEKENKWLIIELNPYKSSTGAALFDWNADKELLHSSGSRTESNLPELRIRSEVIEGLDDMVNFVVLPPFGFGNENNSSAQETDVLQDDDELPWDEFLLRRIKEPETPPPQNKCAVM